MSKSDQMIDDERPSKSQRKRDMHALQKLGETLVNLPVAKLKKISIPEELADAITEMHLLKSHEAKRRQLQYIGRLMRNLDPEPIKESMIKMQRVTKKPQP